MTRLGERTGRNLWRLWIEDNGFQRLQRNNFSVGTGFRVHRRAGVGLVIEASVLASCHVSSRRGAGVLSYEASDLATLLPVPEVRVRIHVGRIIVMPSVRFHTIARPATEHWQVCGDELVTPGGTFGLRTPEPLRLPQVAAQIEVHLEERNLVYSTELIGNLRPSRVVISGEAVLLTVASQFLRAAGYSETANPGEFAR